MTWYSTSAVRRPASTQSIPEPSGIEDLPHAEGRGQDEGHRAGRHHGGPVPDPSDHHGARHIRSIDVVVCLADLFLLRGPPEYIRSDNGPEFTAALVRKWLADLGVQTLFIEPGSPWENGYIESFNGKLRDELLDGEIFYSLREAQVLVEMWRQHYNRVRPHSALGYRPPAPEAVMLRETRGVVGLTH